MNPWRPEFEAGLRLLAQASEAMARRGFTRPVLVGGAVEIYSGGAIATGDFDISVPRQDVFEEELQRLGFARPTGPGRATRGWVHAEFGLGVEVVSDSLLDGNADRARVRLIDISGEGVIAIIAVEDMIADRIGQYASGTAREMLAQARALARLFPDVDRSYMDRRIREESAGDHGIEILED